MCGRSETLRCPLDPSPRARRDDGRSAAPWASARCGSARCVPGRWRLLLPIAARLGLAARMTADQHADFNIELNEIGDASVPVLDRLTCPVWFVMATGDSLGTPDGEKEHGRAALDPLLARNPNIKVSAKV